MLSTWSVYTMITAGISLFVTVIIIFPALDAYTREF